MAISGTVRVARLTPHQSSLRDACAVLLRARGHVGVVHALALDLRTLLATRAVAAHTAEHTARPHVTSSHTLHPYSPGHALEAGKHAPTAAHGAHTYLYVWCSGQRPRRDTAVSRHCSAVPTSK